MRTVYTDSPVTQLGDRPNEYAPIRQFNLLAWDGNKYATLKEVESGEIVDVKTGYIFTDWDIYDNANRVPSEWFEEVQTD